MIERGRSIEVRTHLGDFLPYAAIVPNKTVVGWSKRSGADGLEWVGARLPTVEVNLCSTGYLKKAFQGHLKSGHAVFGQHFTFLSAFRLLIDQSYPVSWKTILPMKVMTVEEQTSKRALIKLQSLLGNDFPITVYPPYGNIGIEEEYSKPLVQIVGGMTSAELEDPVAHWIALYKADNIAGVTYDTAHAWGNIFRSNRRPYGNSLDEQKRTLERFVNEGALAEVHVQTPQINNNEGMTDIENEFLGMIDHDYTTLTGQLVQFIKNELGFSGPYVIEMDPRLWKYRFGKLVPFRLPGKEIFSGMQAAIQFVKQA